MESQDDIEFEGTIDASILKDVLSALTAVVDEGVLRFNEKGVTSKSVDPANVAMVSLDLKRDVFSEYNLKGENILKVSVDFDKLLHILKLCKGDIKIRINTRKVQMSTGYFSYNLPFVSLDALRREPKVPEIEFTAAVTIGLEDFKQGIHVADIITDYMEIGVNGEEFFMGVDDGRGKFKLVIPKEDLTLFNVDREGKSKHSTVYLRCMASGVAGELVTLEIKNGFPLQMQFTVTDGCEVTYLLAPRIDKDD